MSYPSYKDHLLDALGYADQDCPGVALLVTIAALDKLWDNDVVLETMSENALKHGRASIEVLKTLAYRAITTDQTGGV